jgi:hypothetical protein
MDRYAPVIRNLTAISRCREKSDHVVREPRKPRVPTPRLGWCGVIICRSEHGDEPRQLA